MEETKTAYNCLNCNRPETAMPLINIRYAGHQAWICSQCMPVLIHHPNQLAGKLVGMEKVEPVPPNES